MFELFPIRPEEADVEPSESVPFYPPRIARRRESRKHYAEDAESGRHFCQPPVDTAAMLTFFRHATFYFALPGIAGACLVIFLLYRWVRSRAEKALNEAALLRYSNLHLFATALFEGGNAKEMAARTLENTLQALATEDGCLLLQPVSWRDATDELSSTSVRGFSPQLQEQLTEGPLRDFLASSAERWGGIMVFPDLRSPEVAAAWQRDPHFLEFQNLFLAEGTRTLIVVGLRVKELCCGALVVGSRRRRSYLPGELKLLLGLGNHISVAIYNARAYQKAAEQAITDGLTQLKTHRFFMEGLDAEWRRAPRGGHHFSLIMMDLDNFKPVNDRHGHLEGDRILVAVARLIEARSRQSNVVARYGGDEFAILMPEGTVDQAEILAERLRAAMAADPFLASHAVTASFGIASFPVHGAAPEEILRVAEAGMYLAKHHQGNCVRTVSAAAASDKGVWEHQLIEAYLGVAVKRMFATGPEAFNQYFQRFQQAAQKAGDEGLSLLDTVTALAFAIDAKDHYTQGHSQSVSRLAAQVARHLGLDEAEVEEIRLAGILHDIGKIGVPETLLNKPSGLTPDEYEIMKTHAALGWKILEPLRVKSIERIRRMVRHHHERYNGQGYPDGLRGEDIPLGARIISIADSFDTMVSRRAYKEGLPVAAALAELQRVQGEHFDSALVTAFLQSLESLRDPFVRARFDEVVN